MTQLFWREKIMLMAIEGAYGTDQVPGALNGILAKNVRLSPMEGNDTPRDLETPFMGDTGSIPTGLHRRLTFSVELEPSGTAGTPPAWGPALRACGVAETITPTVSVAYNPVTSGQESASVYFWNGGTLYKLLGARGTCVLDCTTEQIPMLEFTLTGLYSPATEQARVVPTNLADFKKPVEFATMNSEPLSMNGVTLPTRRARFDIGNSVETRFLTGADSVIIAGKSEMLEATVEARPLTTFDPYALALSQADVDTVLVHGRDAGRVTTLTIPTAQMQRPAGLEEQQNITEWPLRLKPRIGPAGNDQWTLVLT